MGLAGKAKHCSRMGVSRTSSGHEQCHCRKHALADQHSARIAKHYRKLADCTSSKCEEEQTRRRKPAQGKRRTAYALVDNEPKSRANLDTLISRLHARNCVSDSAKDNSQNASKDLQQFPFLSRNYSDIQHLGSGAYSTVYKGKNRRTGEWCAIKRLRINEADSRDVNGGLCKPPMYETDDINQMRLSVQNTNGSGSAGSDDELNFHIELDEKRMIRISHRGIPSTTLREVSLIRKLGECQNIVKLIEVEHYVNKLKEQKLYVVFECMDMNLTEFLKRRKQPLSIRQIAGLASQICRGLRDIHNYNVIHRDIKPPNLLLNVDSENPTAIPVIKIADFGLSRLSGARPKNFTHEVITLWYRPPEILLNADNYSQAVDIWSVGCVIGELFQHGQPLFMADNNAEIEQLLSIFKVLGTPTKDTWADAQGTQYWHPFPKFSRQPRENWIKQAKVPVPEDALDLLEGLLHCDPSRRLTAEKAFDHPFLQLRSDSSS